MNAEHEAISEESWDSALREAFTGDPASEHSVIDTVFGSGTAPRIRLPDLGNPDAPPLPVAATEIDLRGGNIGRLAIRGEIARGGVGIVLEAHDPDLGREVAVKVLQEEHTPNVQLVRRFIEEAQVGAQLQHPGIVPVYELGLDRTHRPYFAMKLVRGQSLAALLRDRSEAVGERARFLSWFEQVCQTMAYAHAHGVVHRDLKPANIMVGAFGEVLVMDWGFAKVLGSGAERNDADGPAVSTVRSEDDSGLSVPGSRMGTPGYMAPEQARGEVDRVDERTDVFALGAIALEILTGQPPFTGEDRIGRTARGELPDVAARLERASVEPRLAKLVRSCLAAHAADRPRDASAVAGALGEYFGGIEERARQAEIDAATSRARAAAERRVRWLVLAMATTVLVVAATFGWFAWTSSVETARQEERIRGQLTEARGALKRNEFGAALEAVLLAEGAAAENDVSRSIGREAAELRSEIEARRREHDLGMELFRLRGVPDNSDGTDAAYVAAFTAYGISLDGSAEEIHGALTDSGCTILGEVARGLDELALRRLRRRDLDEKPWRHLIGAAALCDANEARQATRRALQGGDRRELDDLDLTHEDAASFLLVALALLELGDRDAAIEMLERGVAIHAEDIWLHLELARHYRVEFPSAAADHEEIAQSLHPDPSWEPFPRPLPRPGQRPGPGRPRFPPRRR